MATLSSLTGAVAARSVELSKLMAAKSLPEPSFDPSNSTRYEDEGVKIRQTRNELASAAQDLSRLAQSPEDYILQMAWSSADTSNLAVILRFDVAQHVPLTSTISASSLARAVNLPVDILTRTLRYAIGNALFLEPTPNHFAHNATSALLASNEHLRNIAVTGTRELSFILLRLADALKLQQTPVLPEKGTPLPPAAAFNVAYPEYHNVFDFLSKDAESAMRYHLYMVGRHHSSRWRIEHIVSAYDWASVGATTIVDAGGSSGHTLLALAPSCPEAKFVIQDVDAVALEVGKKMLAAAADPTLHGRVEWVVHDLFEPQTVKAGVYIFRHVLHDWSDEDVVRMLKAMVPAMETGAKVLVSEGIVPEGKAGVAGGLDEKQILVEDMFMLAIHGGRERTIEDFVRLFKQTDQRFGYVRTTGGKAGAFQSLIEFVWQGNEEKGVNSHATGFANAVGSETNEVTHGVAM